MGNKAARHFDSIASNYNKRKWVKDRSFKKVISSLISLTGKEKILEIGVGTGVFATIFGTDLEKYFGLDVSKKMLSQAMKFFNKENLLIADAENIPFLDDTFDLVCCRNVLKHCSAEKKVVLEMKRVCRPGGKVLVVESCAFNKRDKDLFSQICQITEPHQRPYLLPSEFRKLFRQAGFRKIRSRTFGYPDFSNNKYLNTFNLSRLEKEQVWDIYRNVSPAIKKIRKIKPLKGEPGFQIYLYWTAIIGEK
jgi:SAM-dependent methyltransferase